MIILDDSKPDNVIWSSEPTVQINYICAAKEDYSLKIENRSNVKWGVDESRWLCNGKYSRD